MTLRDQTDDSVGPTITVTEGEYRRTRKSPQGYFAFDFVDALKKSHRVSVAFNLVILGPIAATGANDLLPGH